MITVTLTAEIAQETIIALRDRRFQLQHDQAAATSPAILAIIQRQLDRVETAGRALAEQLREVF